MKSERFKNSAVLLLAAIVAGCSQIAVVSEKPPARFQASPGTNQAIAQTIDRAQALDRSQPQAALEAYANAARDSLHELERYPANTEARRCYNFAVAGIFSVIRTAKLDPWTKPVQVGASSELTLIGRKEPSKPEQNPALYDLIPTDELSYQGRCETGRNRCTARGRPSRDRGESGGVFHAARNLLRRHRCRGI